MGTIITTEFEQSSPTPTLYRHLPLNVKSALVNQAMNTNEFARSLKEISFSHNFRMEQMSRDQNERIWLKREDK